MKKLETKFDKFILMKEDHKDSTEYELKIKNEYSEAKAGELKTILDLGTVDLVPKARIDNIQKTYPNSKVDVKDGHFWLTILK